MYLAEVMPAEHLRGLRSQLEQVELSREDLLRSGDGGQVEAELHLLAMHCKDK